MRKISFVVLTWILLSSPALAAAKSEGLRALANLGPWMGFFEQSDQYNHEASLTTKTSMAIGFQMGWNFSPVFAEYNFAWFLSPHSTSLSNDPQSNPQPHARDAVYYSLLGLNIGVALPQLPIEPFVGIEKSGFGFSAGSRTDFGGISGKLGANVFLTESLGLKAEYKRMWISGDDTGFFPDGISARTDIISAALVFGKR